jgi:hypothetical protein
MMSRVWTAMPRYGIDRLVPDSKELATFSISIPEAVRQLLGGAVWTLNGRFEGGSSHIIDLSPSHSELLAEACKRFLMPTR